MESHPPEEPGCGESGDEDEHPEDEAEGLPIHRGDGLLRREETESEDEDNPQEDRGRTVHAFAHEQRVDQDEDADGEDLLHVPVPSRAPDGGTGENHFVNARVSMIRPPRTTVPTRFPPSR